MRFSKFKFRLPHFSLGDVYSTADYLRIFAFVLPFAALVSSVTGFAPRLLVSSRRVEAGVEFGMFLGLGMICIHRLAFGIRRLHHRESLEIFRTALRKTSWPSLVARFLVAIGGEEVLRALLFTFLAESFAVRALIIQGIVVFLVSFRGRTHLIWTGIQVVQATFLATVFLHTHSFSILVVTRLTTDLILLSVLHSERCWHLFFDPDRRGSSTWQALFPKLSGNFLGSIQRRKKVS